jgi:hypothetical protein
MIFTRFLPGVLKELMKHVPTVLFKAVEWSDLASEFPKITKRIISKEGYQNLFDSQSSIMKPQGITLIESKPDTNEFPEADLAVEEILTVYFTQLLSPHGVFLDLRIQYFTQMDKKLHWSPSPFWARFSDSFSAGLIEVYDGFYYSEEEKFRQGLAKIGLLSLDWRDEDQKKLCDLFRSHFGAAADEKMIFRLEDLQKSIINMANFLLEKKVTINKDFLYLGINLVTLYSTLESIGASVCVAKLYKDLREKLHPRL